MKRSTILLLLLSLSPFLQTQELPENFSRFFTDSTLRVDYFHTGDRERDVITLDRLYKQGTWAGPIHQLVDHWNNGQYYGKVYDAETGQLIYSRGFNSYFYEYRTTNPAIQGTPRTFHESFLFPFPRRKVRLVLENRDLKLQLQTVFTLEIDPDSAYIDTAPHSGDIRITELLNNGHPHEKVDIAVVAEGYRIQDREKLQRDFQRATDVLFSHEPYRSQKNHFNVYGVFSPSKDPGCDEPRQGIYRSTAVETSFNALDLPRYLLVEDQKRLQNVLARVPSDAVIVMVNHQRYGGGGIYNQYCVFTADSPPSAYLLLHEFGHSFAGLGDEYYASQVSYNDFIPAGTEPLEPNVTALLEPGNLKWKHLVTPGTPIPTPWDKAAYEKKRGNARREHLEDKKFSGVVGAFQGAMYVSEGMYRPAIDCIMFSRNTLDYCPVCANAVSQMIRHFSGK